MIKVTSHALHCKYLCLRFLVVTQWIFHLPLLRNGSLDGSSSPDWNMSTTTWWIAVKFCTDIYSPQRKKPNDFGDTLLLLHHQQVKVFTYTEKYLNIYLMDCHQLLHRQSLLRVNKSSKLNNKIFCQCPLKRHRSFFWLTDPISWTTLYVYVFQNPHK